MKVGWFQDLNFWTHLGGAQRTDREIVKYGMRKGYEVELVTPENFPPIHDMNHDLVVFSNVHMLMSMDSKRILEVAEKLPHVVFHHDYWCRYRLFYPMKPKCSRCPYLPPWRKLYSESRLIIWMSPLHREAWLGSVPELAEHPYALVPSAINPADYTSKVEADPKPSTVIGVNCLYSFKGMQNVLRYAQEHKDLSFTFVGGKEGNPKLPENCTYVGVKTRKELVQLYTEHEALIHVPQNPQPCERIIAEFILANPKGHLIVNDLVGILTYPNVVRNGKVNKEEIIRLVFQSPERFWSEIEGVV